jgi:hypothetical protein
MQGVGGAVRGRPEPSCTGVPPHARLVADGATQQDGGVREIRMVRGRQHGQQPEFAGVSGHGVMRGVAEAIR